MLPSVRPLVRQRTAAGLYGRCYGASGGEQASSSLGKKTECPMPELNDQSRSHTVLKQDSTLIAVLEMSQSAWLVAGLVPGIERHPLKKIDADQVCGCLSVFGLSFGNDRCAVHELILWLNRRDGLRRAAGTCSRYGAH